MAGTNAYAVSKLLAEYCVEEIARLALGKDGRCVPPITAADVFAGCSPRSSPEVLVNSICPGPVRTDLPRQALESSLLVRLLAPALLAAIFQSTEVGARYYAEAGLAGPDQHVSRPPASAGPRREWSAKTAGS